MLSIAAHMSTLTPTKGYLPAFLASPVPFIHLRRKCIKSHAAELGQGFDGKPGQVHTVTYRGNDLQAQDGENLRRLLLRSGCHPHNGGLLVTCKGIGTCGTCAVSVKGRVEPQEPGWRELSRLSFPPHTAELSKKKSLRLACQVRIVEDVFIEKYDGFWGHGEKRLEQMNQLEM